MKITLAALLLLAVCPRAMADPLACSLTAYKSVPGLSATSANNTLTVTWDGDRGQSVRLLFALVNSTPTIKELAVRKGTGAWSVLATDAVPDFRVVSGLRRMSNQQRSEEHTSDSSH